MKNEETDNRIDELVLRYRSGDVEAGAQLLRMFRPLIQKYIHLCLSGKVDPRDWVQAKVLRSIHPDIHTAGSIIKRKLARVDKEDIQAEASLSLLQAALCWRNLSMGFRNIFLRKVLALIKQESYEQLETDLDSAFEQDGLLDRVQDTDTGDIDTLWIVGVTAGPGFDELTPQERYILYLAYWVGMSDSQLAYELGVSMSEARALRRQIITKAEMYLKAVGRLR